MTLTNTTTRLTYNGDGSTTSFSVTFPFWLSDDLRVILRAADGTETVWTRGSEYTVTGGDGSGGTVEAATAPASGEKLVVLSGLPDTQTTSLPAGGPFPSVSVEQRLDQLTRLVQQKEERLGRSLKFSETSPDSSVAFPDITGNANKTVRVKPDASGIEMVDVADGGGLTIPILVEDGGTGADTASGARANLGPWYDDVAALIASTDEWSDGTIIRTREEGFSYRVDSTAAAGTFIVNSAGTPQKLVPRPGSDGSVSILAFGADPAKADNSTAINMALKHPFVTAPAGDFTVTNPLVATKVIRFTGAGSRRDIGAGVTEGTIIRAADTSVTNLFTLESADPDLQGASRIEGADISGFTFIHKGSGAGIFLNNVIRPYIHDLRVDCSSAGAKGVDTKNWAFFSRMERVNVANFTDRGIHLRGGGTQHIIRDCHVQTSEDTAIAAIEVNTNDGVIDGGQYNINRTDNAGVGILLNRVDSEAGAAGGNRIANVIFEHDIGIKITGETVAPRFNVIEKCWFGNTNENTGVLLDRSDNTIIRDPFVPSSIFSEPVVTWGANSLGDTVIAIKRAVADGAVWLVDAGALWALLRVQTRLTEPQSNNVFTDSNLRVVCDDVDRLGRRVHNGTAWDKHTVDLIDDTAASFDLPGFSGTVRVSSRFNNSALVGWQTTNLIEGLVAGSDVAIVSDTVLTGTSGTDGKYSISVSGDKLYLENRTGNTRLGIVNFEAGK